jgi:hypothetical protein
MLYRGSRIVVAEHPDLAAERCLCYFGGLRGRHSHDAFHPGLVKWPGLLGQQRSA